MLDPGAVDAVRERGKSLLVSGIRKVQGAFEAGAFVALTDASGTEFARGRCNFSSSELVRIRGMTSPEAARALGRSRVPEAVHRDHLVLSRELQHG